MRSKISVSDFLFFFEAWVLLGVSRLKLIFIPFRNIVPMLGKTGKKHPNGDFNNNDDKVLQKISVAILRGSKYSLWRSKCFEQALAAKTMVRRRHFESTIYFGVYKNPADEKLMAHAWLISNDEIVTGGPDIDRYTILSSFKS